MTQWLYLIGLLVSITGMAMIDRRFSLAFWHDKRRTVITVLVGMTAFLFWDLMAIRLGIFVHGNSEFALPFTLLPEFPVEELFFLLLLCYCTIVLYRAGAKLWPRT